MQDIDDENATREYSAISSVFSGGSGSVGRSLRSLNGEIMPHSIFHTHIHTHAIPRTRQYVRSVRIGTKDERMKQEENLLEEKDEKVQLTAASHRVFFSLTFFSFFLSAQTKKKEKKNKEKTSKSS